MAKNDQDIITIDSCNLENVSSIVSESHRGCALLGMELVHNLLEELLRLSLPAMPSQNAKEVIDSSLSSKHRTALLGTMASKEIVLFMFGVIDDKLYKALGALRSVRNDAAHLDKRFSFDDPSSKLAKAMTTLIDTASPTTRANIEKNEKMIQDCMQSMHPLLKITVQILSRSTLRMSVGKLRFLMALSDLYASLKNVTDQSRKSRDSRMSSDALINTANRDSSDKSSHNP